MHTHDGVQHGAGIRRRDGFLSAFLSAIIVLIAMAASALGQTSALAPDTSEVQPQIQAPAQTSPRPARKPFRSARLTFLTGDVLVEQAGNANQEAAVLNMPLVEGAFISTGEEGQAEIEFEDGSLIRLTPNSGLSLVKLSIDGSGNFQTRAAMSKGLAYLELRAGTKYQYTIDAGGDLITPVENSTIRVELDEPPAAIAVLDGLAHIATASGSSDVDASASQTVRRDAASEGSTYQLQSGIAPESWDQWNEDRDRAAASEAAAETAARDQYAGDQGYGWSDLDANGNWYDVPGQGEVWQPNLADDAGGDTGDTAGSFDPYSYGSWVWTPAGYSWASGYSWGWLPYRCGQWSWWDGFGWGWQPSFACGVFGFGGYGYGYGGIVVSHAPGYWHRPRRPIPGPGPFHPIVRGVYRGPRVASGRPAGGRVIDVKTIAGKTVQPLSPVGSENSGSFSVIGAGLHRDYPVSTSTREPVLGVIATHSAPLAGQSPWQPGNSAGGSAAPRSHMMPAQPSSGYAPRRSVQTPSPTYGRPAPVSRPAPAPASHYSPPPASAPSHTGSSASPHK